VVLINYYCYSEQYPQGDLVQSTNHHQLLSQGGKQHVNLNAICSPSRITIASPTRAAFALSSTPFLQELVQHKDTCNEKYYHFENNNEEFDIAPRSNPTHAVEYTGRLWFLRKTPLQFQEAIRVKQISSCGTSSSIECVTKFKYGPHSDWIPCCVIVCNLSQKGFDSDGKPKIHVKVSSNLLLRLPLLGTRQTISKQICHVFTKAAYSFLSRKETTCKFIVL
jgi:hypothetical protein